MGQKVSYLYKYKIDKYIYYFKVASPQLKNIRDLKYLQQNLLAC